MLRLSWRLVGLVVPAVWICGCVSAGSTSPPAISVGAPPMSAAPATSSPERQGAPPSTAAGSAFAAAAALRLASIGGPLTVEEVRHGTYAELWDGSTNDLSGVGTASRASRAPLTVWRVLVAGPNGSEELFIVDPGGVLIDTITQGQ